MSYGTSTIYVLAEIHTHGTHTVAARLRGWRGSENPAAPETARCERGGLGNSLDTHGEANKARYSLPTAATK